MQSNDVENKRAESLAEENTKTTQVAKGLNGNAFDPEDEKREDKKREERKREDRPSRRRPEGKEQNSEALIKKQIIKIVVLLLIALISFTKVADWASSPTAQASTITALDDKKATVMKLTAASTAASAAITLIPGDVATPIAEKLADLSGYFLFILCALYFEKYLITIGGFVAFRILIPLACGLLLANVWLEKETLRRMAIKMATFALILFMVMPVSMRVSDMIQATYQESIDQTIQAAEQEAELLQEDAQQMGGADNWLEGIISTVEGGVSAIVDQFKLILGNMVDAVAVLIVTSCVIPIAMLLLLIWFARLLFSVDIPMPNAGYFNHMRRRGLGH